jgi:diacylglycerol kinase (ATP)
MKFTNENTKMSILLIINPVSGNGPRERIFNLFEQYSKRMNFSYKIYETTKHQDRQNISKLLEEDNYDRVIVAGGDGTINIVGSLLVNTNIKLGIIPIGSANGLACELDIPDDPEEAFKIAMGNTIRSIDAIHLGNDKYCFHLSDFGLNARVVKRFEQSGKRGLSSYARQYMRELFRAYPGKFKIGCQNEMVVYKAEMVVIANARHYGTGAMINPTGEIDDGRFEICIIKPYPVYAIFIFLFAFLTGRLHKMSYVKILSCTEATIHNLSRHPFQLDGEVSGEPQKIHFEIVYRCIDMLMP